MSDLPLIAGDAPAAPGGAQIVDLHGVRAARAARPTATLDQHIARHPDGGPTEMEAALKRRVTEAPTPVATPQTHVERVVQEEEKHLLSQENISKGLCFAGAGLFMLDAVRNLHGGFDRERNSGQVNVSQVFIGLVEAAMAVGSAYLGARNPRAAR